MGMTRFESVVYGWLMRVLLPGEVVREYGSEVRDTFSRVLKNAREERGRRGVLQAWVREAWQMALHRGRHASLPGELRGSRYGTGRRAGFRFSEVRYALRSLIKHPGYSAAFIATMALAIGMNTAIFSLLNGVLLQGLPYEDADRILYVKQPARLAGVDNTRFSFIEIDDYRDQVNNVDEFVEYGDWTHSVVGRGDPHRAVAGLVTSNYFEVLHLRAALGRTLTPEDDEADAAPVVVLTDGYWRRVFGADPEVIGATLELSGISSMVVGVLEPGVHYTGSRTQEFFTNYTTNAHYLGAAMRDARSHRMTDIFARLDGDATLETARAEILGVGERLRSEYPEDYPDRLGYGTEVVRWQDELTKNARPVLMMLMGVVGLVLLLACANVANLSLARLVRREHELAVRSALGADRRTITRQVLVENLVLALLGALGGLGLAALGMSALSSYAARFTVRTSEIAIDTQVLLFAGAVAIIAAIVLAWAPMLPFGRNLARSIMQGGRGASGGGVSRKRLQRGLVVAQLALSFTLLIGAGLLVHSLVRLQNIDPGFDFQNVVTMDAPNFSQLDPERNLDLFEEVAANFRNYPGVTSIAYASSVPWKTGNPLARTFEVEGEDIVEGLTPMGSFSSVSRSYFSTLGVPLLKGRFFEMTDDFEADSVAIINDAMAKVYFPDGEDPIGKRIRWQSFSQGNFFAWATIVGVVADSRDHGVAQAGVHTVYLPVEQSRSTGVILARTRGDTGPLVGEIRSFIRDIDPRRPVDNVFTLEELRANDIAPQRLNATLFGSFAVLALVIAAVGVLGVLGFNVSQRTNEFGIRMALGAERGEVLRMVVREGAVLAALGLVVGGAASLVLTRLLSGMLFEVEPTDPLAFAAGGAALFAATLLSTLAPAQRATSVDPLHALKQD